jgi:hypothetical protein
VIVAQSIATHLEAWKDCFLLIIALNVVRLKETTSHLYVSGPVRLLGGGHPLGAMVTGKGMIDGILSKLWQTLYGM